MEKFYLDFGGNSYYLDFEELDNFLFTFSDDKIVKDTEIIKQYDCDGVIISSKVIEKNSINQKEINGVRYEIINGMVEVILNSNSGEGNDDLLGAKRALNDTPISYKMAFNTLIKYNIIKEIK